MSCCPTESAAWDSWTRSLDLRGTGADALGRIVFALIADPHCTATPSSIRHGKRLDHLGDGVARLRLCFEPIRDLPPAEKPAFVVLLSDIGIEGAEPVLAEAPFPVHVVAGNHDWGSRRRRLREFFPDDFGTGASQSDYYAFDQSGVRFLFVCNAGIGNEHVGQFSSEDIWPPGQTDWLVGQLTVTAGLRVVLGHCPPEPAGFDRRAYVSSGAHRFVPYMGENDSRWFHLLLAERGPIAAFFGHVHRGTTIERVGSSTIHIVRSCHWNHDGEPIGLLLARIDPTGLCVREITTGEPRRI